MKTSCGFSRWRADATGHVFRLRQRVKRDPGVFNSSEIFYESLILFNASKSSAKVIYSGYCGRRLIGNDIFNLPEGSLGREQKDKLLSHRNDELFCFDLRVTRRLVDNHSRIIESAIGTQILERSSLRLVGSGRLVEWNSKGEITYEWKSRE